MIAVDTTLLLPLLDPRAPLTPNPATGRPPDRGRARLEHLVETLRTERRPILIPTPVLAELLVRANSETQADYVSELTRPPFRIADFDTRAAVEAAVMLQGALPIATGSLPGTRAEVKFDVQIVAIAKVNAIDALYSDDAKQRDLAARAGVTTVSTWNLPEPPEDPQTSIFDGDESSEET